MPSKLRDALRPWPALPRRWKSDCPLLLLLLLPGALESAGCCGNENAGPPRPALPPPRPTAILWLRPWPPRPPRVEGCSPELAPPGLASRLELPPAEGRGNWKPEVFLLDSASSAAFLASESARECRLACPEPAAPPPRPRTGPRSRAGSVPPASVGRRRRPARPGTG